MAKNDARCHQAGGHPDQSRRGQGREPDQSRSQLQSLIARRPGGGLAAQVYSLAGSPRGPLRIRATLGIVIGQFSDSWVVLSPSAGLVLFGRHHCSGAGY